jgi:transcriptional regulator with XRE-family HTH domain
MSTKTTSHANTRNNGNQLPPSLVKLIRRHRGMQAEVARLGGFSRAYVWNVLHGKAPSEKFIRALGEALARDSDITLSAAAGIEFAQFTRKVRA